MHVFSKILMMCCIVFVGISKSQDSNFTNIKAGWGSLNYAVPESPAFKILEVNQDNIMRPTTTRDIGIAIGNYYISNGSTIPRNLSVEIAPSLFNPSISLVDYQNFGTRLWYTSSFSFGTKINQNGSYDIALGIKIKLVDHADLRQNDTLNKFINSIGPDIANAFEDALNQIALDLNISRFDAAEAYNDSTKPQHIQIVKRVNERKLVQKISEYRQAIKNSLWNAEVWDLGIAALFPSKDSLIKHLEVSSKIGLWTTYGRPLFGTMGQLLIGLNSGIEDDSSGVLNTGNLGIGLRAYYGKNDTKGFIQGESNFIKSQLPLFQAGVGLETTFAGSIWIDFSVNLKKTGSQPFIFSPGINISYGNPEKKK